jgi:hypothetical protein
MNYYATVCWRLGQAAADDRAKCLVNGSKCALSRWHFRNPDTNVAHPGNVGRRVARLAAMVPFERSSSIERRRLASAVERDFRALVERLNRDISGDDFPELVAIKAKAESGLKLAIELARELDANDDDPLA